MTFRTQVQDIPVPDDVKILFCHWSQRVILRCITTFFVIIKKLDDKPP